MTEEPLAAPSGTYTPSDSVLLLDWDGGEVSSVRKLHQQNQQIDVATEKLVMRRAELRKVSLWMGFMCDLKI